MKTKVISSLIIPLLLVSVIFSTSSAMVVPANLDPYNTGGDSSAPPYNLPTQPNPPSSDASTITSSTTVKNNIKNDSESKNTSPNIWYWLVAFLVIVFSSLFWGFRKLK